MSGDSLRALVVRLIDDAKAYALAEFKVVRATALAWLKPAKIAVPLVLAAVILVQAAFTALVAALGFLLAIWLGPAAGFAIAGLLALLIAAGLVALAVSQFSKGAK